MQLTKPEAGNEIYDPTVGSGGFLIQSYQYVEEQGQDPNDLSLYGQDSNGTVWSICNMNMILHNITKFTIENGDTLEDPLILANGNIKKFDRVLANPPFSQNYSRSQVKFTSRFREWCPEIGKKADLMFVQHMIASLKSDGHMATIMPHGVLFRKGKEKLIREMLIEDDVIEAIIGLPPGLFYGTGIPACVIVVNKSKPDKYRNKILFINADREFAEGKAQNKLRPEDIEKIDYVFANKIKLTKYSKLVDKNTIADEHDYNLNIRRYVDNTPEPEPEDVQAHLMGGIPHVEVNVIAQTFDKFGINSADIFCDLRPGYLSFSNIIKKSDIKSYLDTHSKVIKIIDLHTITLEDWWALAKIDFSELRDGKTMPEVRNELLTSIKTELMSIGLLDEFKSAGIFVNWWQNIRYDLKTIVSTGWHHSLIPDEYIINAYFQKEVDGIEALQVQLSEGQSNLTEAVEAAQDAISYEPETDENGNEEKITATLIKLKITEYIDDLSGSQSSSAAKEILQIRPYRETINEIEKKIKDTKAEYKEKVLELEIKIQLKREGKDDLTAENLELLKQIEDRLPALDPNNKVDKKTISILEKDKKIMETKIRRIDEFFTSIGGRLSAEECRSLILKKLYDIINQELTRYMNTEKRTLINAVENLWDKYAVSNQQLERERIETLKALDGYLKELGYLR